MSYPDFIRRDIHRVAELVIREVERTSPYIAIAGKTQEIEECTVKRSAEEGDRNIPISITGETEYTYDLRSIRGRGPDIFIAGNQEQFKVSYSAENDALKRQIRCVMNNDARRTYFDRSGLKATCQFRGMEINGGVNEIDTSIPSSTPSPIYRSALLGMAQKMSDNLSEPCDKEGRYFVIGSEEAARFVGWKNGAMFNGYDFSADGKFLYGCDIQPLRYNELKPDGSPMFIEPEVIVASSDHMTMRINSEWLNAKNEILFMAGLNSFARTANKSETAISLGFEMKAEFKKKTGPNGESTNEDDRSTMFHFYELTRAWKPIRPHSVVPIAFQRTQ